MRRRRWGEWLVLFGLVASFVLELLEWQARRRRRLEREVLRTMLSSEDAER